MNAPKFTPGPWQVVTTFGRSGLIEKVGGLAIASVTGYYNRQGQTEPNAYLIAAAPELYAQLEFAVKLLEGLPGFAGTAQVDAMRAALAKAVQP